MAANSGTGPSSIRLGPDFILWKSPVTGPTKDKQLPSSSASRSSVLVLLFTWLFCKPYSAQRYVGLYTSKGYDVLQISSHVAHFLWPPNSKKFAQDITKVLKSSCADYSDMVVHAMSIGAYNYTTFLHLAQEQTDTRDFFISKIRGIVFDSLTLGTMDNMINGIAVGISQWRLIQMGTVALARAYLLLTQKNTADVHEEEVDFFKTCPIAVPTLIFGSKNDPMCDAAALQCMIDQWKLKFPVTSKIWDKSGHCAHAIHHCVQYEQLLNDFLRSLPLSISQNGVGDVHTKISSKL